MSILAGLAPAANSAPLAYALLAIAVGVQVDARSSVGSPRLGLVGASPKVRITLRNHRHSTQLVGALAGMRAYGELTRLHGTRTADRRITATVRIR
jgi:hypothetical protein